MCVDEYCLVNIGSSDLRSRRLLNNEVNYICVDKYIMNDFFFCFFAILCFVLVILEFFNVVFLICYKLFY